MQFAFNIKYLYPFPNEAKKLHFPAQYVENIHVENKTCEKHETQVNEA